MANRKTIAELERGMTPKQIKLARALAEGGISKVEAYRQVYGWNGKSKNACQVKATEAAGNGKVSVLATAIRDQGTARIWQNKARFQNWLMSGITSTIDNTESDITRLKALELAGRTRYASLFEEPQANESGAELSGAIVDVIRAKLAMLAGVSLSGESLSGSDRDGLELEAVPTTPTGGGEGDEGV